MPFELRVTPGEFLARVRGWGSDDFASTTEAIRRIGEDPRLLPGMPVLMDVRELDYLATPPEVTRFAAGPQFLAGHRVALLVRRGTQFGVAKSFVEKSGGADERIEVFAEPELAAAWIKARE
ncbi:MAG TPA: hypothetical protein VGO79_05285 [Thermoanaerobaculia bacterium]